MNDEHGRSEAVEQTLARVKALARRSTRDREGCFWIEGIRHFVRACDAELQFDTILHSPTLLKSDLAEMLARRLAVRGVRRIRISPEQFRTVSFADRASGIGAIGPPTLDFAGTGDRAERSLLDRSGADSIAGKSGDDPTHRGSGRRERHHLPRPVVRSFSPRGGQGSMGGVLGLALVRATFPQLRSWAAKRHIQFVGLSPDGQRLWTDLPSAAGVALVVGEERGGLSDRLRSLCHLTVRLPVAGGADSLNVAVATGVMLYELVRRAGSQE